MLRRAKQFKGVSLKARPGLATVQTRQAATSGDDARLRLKKKKKKSHANSTCTTDRRIRD
uniref:Uncharacterized protein n=1 Tax=Cebus imitator TaxID=2715852 RepID=A0A2K5QB96_CEBIM